MVIIDNKPYVFDPAVATRPIGVEHWGRLIGATRMPPEPPKPWLPKKSSDYYDSPRGFGFNHYSYIDFAYKWIWHYAVWVDQNK